MLVPGERLALVSEVHSDHSGLTLASIPLSVLHMVPGLHIGVRLCSSGSRFFTVQLLAPRPISQYRIRVRDLKTSRVVLGSEGIWCW